MVPSGDPSICAHNNGGRRLPEEGKRLESRATQGEQHLRFWRDRLQRRSFVYVIQGKPDSPIKIGVARDPQKRMATLQTGSWETLHLLHVIPGGRQQEQEFHTWLRDAGCWIGGEWFRGPEVAAFLTDIESMARRMVEAAEGVATPHPDVTPGMVPGTNDPEPAEVTQARWSRISDCWLGGDTRRTIRLKLDLTETQLDTEIRRMRENGYELAEGLTLRTGDPSVSRTGNFRKLGRGGARAA